MDKSSELDPDLLSQYINGFFGYGNYSGKWWFIGMEEGGGADLAEIQRRLAVWHDRDKHELEDVSAYHLQLGERQFFTDPVKLQSTWNKLIRIILGNPAGLDEVKIFQRDRFGRWDSDHCLIELLPLPSRTTGHWQYSELNSMPHLRTREHYRQHFAVARAAHIRNRIAEYRPKGVVFYSVNSWYMTWWKYIAGLRFGSGSFEGQQFFAASDKHTRYVITRHPVSHGVSTEYFQRVGQLLRM